MNRTTGLLVACAVGDLAAGALGYATGGVDGGVVAAIAFALALAVVGGLLLAVGLSVGIPGRIGVRRTAAGAVAVAGWSVLSMSVLELTLPLWAFYGAVALAGVLLGVTCESPTGGLWHGVLACGTGGVLTVYRAIYGAFTIRPELDGFVVLLAVVVPLAFGVAGGLGGGLGGVAIEAVDGRRVSE